MLCKRYWLPFTFRTKHKGLQLTCPFDAYFSYSVKRRWLQRNQKKFFKGGNQLNRRSDIFNDRCIWTCFDWIEIEKNKKKKVVSIACFKKLGRTACKDLLKTNLSKYQWKTCAQKLGVTLFCLCTPKRKSLWHWRESDSNGAGMRRNIKT